ncbi:MAG TPA: hypothetical protein DCX25_01965 [Candidatus Pacebacteria bacterium]|nr:MAG: NUDIX hydrolase [Microgenomates group bacterium GW2011_GWB1_45_17]KKU23134.1 MAG: NUDIX hydrolase [Microgenomates group bacterium GW2011_GWA1_46_15]KKU23797.1 MAG: NUDIX hydrolase, 7,8-dihydro-8-oxoguanine triphosphatase [Microgenomates group bacterium GW2011_GWC1_46_15]HAV15071.1 hypothetical protein [Candidatus Paceibacterota bacterium]HCR11669.1 hypothetical protein [Candidatus Paceibacterota bacterium]
MADLTHATWKDYPTGKIPKGEFCEHCARFNVRNSTVEIITQDAQGCILMVKRGLDPQKGWWALPGGYVDWDETLAATATRELFEETGLRAKTMIFFRLNDDIYRDFDGRQNIGHCFIATGLSGELKKQDEEIEDIQWFSFDKLPEKIAFDHKKVIDEYVKTV